MKKQKSREDIEIAYIKVKKAAEAIVEAGDAIWELHDKQVKKELKREVTEIK